MTRRAEGGQATILVVGMTMLVLATSGLAVDGTRAFLYRRTLQSAADAAALAGAGELDTTRYYASKGRAIAIDPRSAEVAARRWLELRGLDTQPSIRSSEGRIVVVLRGSVPTLFLRLIGLRSVPVAVEAASAPSSIP